MKNFDCKQCKVSAERSIFLTKLFKKLSRSGEARTMDAEVVSKRIASARFPTPGNTWDHLVLFRLSDGTETELIAAAERFDGLTPGQRGSLTWEGDNILSFTEKE